MPRPVVPIFPAPLAASRARSSAAWCGRISGQASLIVTLERTSIPACSSVCTSLSNACGDTTTPLPMKHATSCRRMPEGIRCSTVCRPSMTSVCPALWPPWKRTTPWAWSVSQSTTLPLPSSPHWVPTTTTLRAIGLPAALCADVFHAQLSVSICQSPPRFTNRRSHPSSARVAAWPGRSTITTSPWARRASTFRRNESSSGACGRENRRGRRDRGARERPARAGRG